MQKNDKINKTIGAGIIILLTVSSFATVATSISTEKNDFIDGDKNPCIMGTLNYYPKSHDFGDLPEGVTRTTTFEIWRSGGCCVLEYWLTFRNCPGLSVFPTSGTSHGERDTITVTLDTTGLQIGSYVYRIRISTNGCGEGIFTITFNIVESEEPASDLRCDGELSWTEVTPGSTVTGSFTIENIGESESILDWEVDSYPTWGSWSFTPKEGSGLKPEHGKITVEVSVIAPSEKNQNFNGEVRVVNKNNPNDVGVIPVTLATPRNNAINPLFQIIQERHLHLLPIIQEILGL